MAGKETQKDGTKTDATDDKKAAAMEAAKKFAENYSITRHVTLPLLKPVVDIAVFVKITDKMFLGKEIKTGDKKDMEPAMLVNIIDLQTGEPCQMILNKVFESILLEEYEDDKYVGLSFAITKKSKREGKRYHGFEITEIGEKAKAK